MKIGFIGLGNLGTPIALNLLESGHQLFVYNRTTAKTAPLTAKGAVATNSIEALAKECHIVFSIVSDDNAVRSICTGEQGLLAHLAPGSIHVNISTILPATAAEMAALHEQHGLNYLAAPVFGRPEIVTARKANFVISGKESARKQIEPLLKDAGGAGVWDFGDMITAANTVKLCGNFLIGAASEAIGESTTLAQNSGVDTQKMWSMFTQTLFNAPIYHIYSAIIANAKYEPAAFTMPLGLKDIKLVLQQADQVNQNMPLAQLLQQHMETLISQGKGHLDWSAVSLATH
jgi:3-hydroxyisobutyrate dehydrogenase-like beta-hydroxyacid dehydrogenase